MNLEEANKIKVTEETAVAYTGGGETVTAEKMQRWAYRRLVTWPALLAACKAVSSDTGDWLSEELDMPAEDLLQAIHNAMGAAVAAAEQE